MSFTVDSKQLERNMDAFPDKVEAALEIYGKTAAAALQSQAKRNRPWTDRSGRARGGLTGSSDLTSHKVNIVLAHTVDYGLWLELAHEKNYAIVEPTVRLERDGIVQGMEHLIDKIKI